MNIYKVKRKVALVILWFLIYNFAKFPWSKFFPSADNSRPFASFILSLDVYIAAVD